MWPSQAKCLGPRRDVQWHLSVSQAHLPEAARGALPQAWHLAFCDLLVAHTPPPPPSSPFLSLPLPFFSLSSSLFSSLLLSTGGEKRSWHFASEPRPREAAAARSSQQLAARASLSVPPGRGRAGPHDSSAKARALVGGGLEVSGPRGLPQAEVRLELRPRAARERAPAGGPELFQRMACETETYGCWQGICGSTGCKLLPRLTHFFFMKWTTASRKWQGVLQELAQAGHGLEALWQESCPRTHTHICVVYKYICSYVKINI